MKTLLRTLAFLLFSFSIISISLAQTSQSKQQEDWNQPYKTMIQAYKELNLELMHKVYLVSAMYLSPGNRQKIRTGTPSFFPDFNYMFTNNKEKGDQLDLSFMIERRIPSDKTVVDIGYYKLTVEQANGIDRSSFGKFITVLEKDEKDGRWKFSVDGFSNAPPVQFMEAPDQAIIIE